MHLHFLYLPDSIPAADQYIGCRMRTWLKLLKLTWPSCKPEHRFQSICCTVHDFTFNIQKYLQPEFRKCWDVFKFE